MNDTAIKASLNSLEPVDLDSLSSVRLMNRIETKYLFSATKLGDLINHLDGKYKVLEIDSLRSFPYLTTYMDTFDYLFYNQHIRGEYERHKIRYRKYEVTGISFLEVKKKTNKRRTIKWRIENNLLADSFDDQAGVFIEKHSNINSLQLKPVIENRFTRATFMSIETKERITIDYDISFRDLSSGRIIEIPFLAVAELKKESYSQFSNFTGIIKHFNIYPKRFSKYCVGSAILNDKLKRNILKQKLLLLNRIENEYISSIGN